MWEQKLFSFQKCDAQQVDAVLFFEVHFFATETMGIPVGR
jgi:hypothetical protein